jgi:hypothetical protein
LGSAYLLIIPMVAVPAQVHSRGDGKGGCFFDSLIARNLKMDKMGANSFTLEGPWPERLQPDS